MKETNFPESLIDLITQLVGEAQEDGYEDQDKVPTSDDLPEDDEFIDLSTLTRVEKLQLLVDDTLDNLLTGEIIIENGDELLAVAKAVALCEQLSA